MNLLWIITGVVAMGLAIGVSGALLTGAYLLHRDQQQRVQAQARPARKIPRSGGWLAPPRVLIHRSCPVESHAIESAVSYWRSLGHSFGSVDATDNPRSVRGAILIVGHRGGGGATSIATRIAGQSWLDPVDFERITRADHYCEMGEIASVFEDGQVDHAVIVVPPPGNGVNLDRLIIHRLGHALGYHHVDSVPSYEGAPRTRTLGHIMSCLLPEAGWDSEGLSVK